MSRNDPGGRPMSISIEATYKDGVLKPRKRLKLPEGAEVRVTITAVDEVEDPLEKVIGICNTGRTDGAENHDKYLYGKKRR
jgi:predicted DNA-binding antitoxin AbrB/MazE fold protein